MNEVKIKPIPNILLILRLARFQFLIASFFLFLMGSLWAVLLGADFSIWRYIFGYLAILPAQLSVSFSNDYYDTYVDTFTVKDVFSGGSGVLVNHPELRDTSKKIALALMLFSISFALFLTVFFSFPVQFLWITIFGNLAGWFYSAPPLILAYRGWGEISTASIAGLLPLTGFLVQNNRITPEGLLLLPPSLLCGLAFILAVEIPDEEADRAGNKKNWVARFGRMFGFTAIAILFLATTSYFLFFSSFLPHPLPMNHWILTSMSLIPLLTSFVAASLKPITYSPASKAVRFIIVALSAFLILINVYFFLLAKSRLV